MKDGNNGKITCPHENRMKKRDTWPYQTHHFVSYKAYKVIRIRFIKFNEQIRLDGIACRIRFYHPRYHVRTQSIIFNGEKL